jgi:hypothetical protein
VKNCDSVFASVCADVVMDTRALVCADVFIGMDTKVLVCADVFIGMDTRVLVIGMDTRVLVCADVVIRVDTRVLVCAGVKAVVIGMDTRDESLPFTIFMDVGRDGSMDVDVYQDNEDAMGGSSLIDEVTVEGVWDNG